MRTETTVVMISFLCFFFSIYFAILSVYVTMNEWLKEQLLAAATSFFVGGTSVAVLLVVLKIIAKICSRKRPAKAEYPHL